MPGAKTIRSNRQSWGEVMGVEEIQTAGDILRAAREAAGRSIKDISEELNIRTSHLDAIERNALDRLPALAFSTGFVRSYATTLGLDGQQLSALWRGAAGQDRIVADLKFPEPVTESRLPGRTAVTVASAAVLAIYFGWIADFGAAGHSETEVSPVPERLTQATYQANDSRAPVAADAALTSFAALEAGKERVVAEASPAVATDMAVAVAPEKSLAAAASKGVRQSGDESRVQLVASKDCWIRVVDADGGEVWSGVLRAGQRWSPTANDLKLMTSNAGGLRVIVDGEEIGALGEGGAVARDVPLDADRLKRREKLAMR